MVSRENYLLVKGHLKYLEEVEQLSSASLQRTWFWLRHLLLWAGETLLRKASVIRPTFPAYISALTVRDGKTGLAPISQKKIIAASKRFFLWAKSMRVKGFVQVPPAWIETLRPARLVSSGEEHVYVTLEEAVILATLPVDPFDLARRRDQAAAAMLFLSGARSSAFVSLPIQAVNLTAGCVNQWPELGVKTKNRKRATSFLLPIPWLLEIVEVWDRLVRERLPPEAPWYSVIENHWGEQNLTPSAPGENRNQTLTRRLRKLFAAAGLPYKSAHKFRHVHAVYGLQHARTMADYKAVSMNLMHEDISTTDEIYAPILTNEVKDRISQLTMPSSSQSDPQLADALSNLSNTELAQLMRLAAQRLCA